MKKIVLSLAVVLASTTAFAGGLNTNTNANAAFLRFFAQDANVSLTSLYANPAGSAFLTKGWHFGICDQIAIQQRNVTTSLPLFAYNPNNAGSSTHLYKGDAFAPLIPSMDFSYNSGKKWSINAHFGVIGGGGACEYLDGIGSFESMYAGKMYSAVAVPYFTQAIPAYMQAGYTKEQATAIANNNYKYSTDAYMKGNSYIFGISVGATYKVTDNLAVFAGVRGVYATANYNGYVQDAMFSTDGGSTYTYALDQTATQTVAGQDVTTHYRNNTLSMNCNQTGWGVTPILGIHWVINKHWNVAMKYEFKTRIRMNNTTRANDYTEYLMSEQIKDPTTGQMIANTDYNSTLGQFADGKSIANDIPGLLGVGVQYSPIENVRIGLGYHWLQETRATQYNNKQNLIDKDTHEVLFSAEWKCCKYLTVSAGYQRTMYGVGNDYMNDVSFNLTNNSIGCGVRIHPSKLFNIDLGYMHTFYGSRTVTDNNWQRSGLTKTDVYDRNNDVIGVGLNFAW